MLLWSHQSLPVSQPVTKSPQNIPTKQTLNPTKFRAPKSRIHILPRNLIQPIHLLRRKPPHIHPLQHPRIHPRIVVLRIVHPPWHLRQRLKLLGRKLVELVRHDDAADLAEDLGEHAPVELVSSDAGLVAGEDDGFVWAIDPDGGVLIYTIALD